MKRNIIILATIFTFGLSASIPASAMSVSEAAMKILGFVASTKGGKAAICKKADITKGIVSVRSFSGIGCTNKTVAAFALKYCADYADFNGSSCDAAAKKALGGENVNKALGDQLATGTKAEKDAICKTLDEEDMTAKQLKACKDAE